MAIQKVKFSYAIQFHPDSNMCIFVSPKPTVLCGFNIHRVKVIFADTFTVLTLNATAITSPPKPVLQRGDAAQLLTLAKGLN